MPTFTTLALNDGLATPISRNWSPVSNEKGIATFRYSPTEFAGEPHMDRILTVSQKKQGNGAYRTTIKFVNPVVHAPSSEGTGTMQNDVNICEMSFRSAAVSTTADRSNNLAFAMNFLAHANASGLVEGLESYFS